MEQTLPDILRDKFGEPITSADGWRENREYIRALLCENEYGFLPPPPDRMSFQVAERVADYCASKAVYEKVLITVEVGEKAFSFPIYAVTPRAETPSMAFVHVNFRTAVPDRYMPTEEIVDGGMAVFSFGYQDVSSDDGDFTNGLAGLFFQGCCRKGNDPGKIALWAWACMRVMDYIETREDVDKGKVAVVGHSRLGKTALLAAAMDQRFACAISNDSGCSGAAISRGKQGERIGNITGVFPFWFCENYQKYADNEEAMPFDQHFLLALIAPRRLYVCSAEGDVWADPKAELRACKEASAVYGLFGLHGLVCETEPSAGGVYHQGEIGYHMRAGTHYLSRYDWQQFMAYLNTHK